MATETETLRVSIPAHELEELERITGQKPSKWIRANMVEIIALARGEQLRQDASSILRSTRELIDIVMTERQQIAGAINSIQQLKSNMNDFSGAMLKVSRSINDERAMFIHVVDFLKGLHSSYSQQQSNIALSQQLLPEVVDLLKRINSALYPAEDGDL